MMKIRLVRGTVVGKGVAELAVLGTVFGRDVALVLAGAIPLHLTRVLHFGAKVVAFDTSRATVALALLGVELELAAFWGAKPEQEIPVLEERAAADVQAEPLIQVVS